MKGGLAAMMCALKDVEDQKSRASEADLRARRGSEELDEPLHRHRVQRGLGVTSPHRRAHGHAHRGRGQGRAGDADRRARACRSQLDPVARRQRRAQGDRRVPRDRVAAVLAGIIGDVRSPVDQPRRIEGGNALNMVPDRCEMAVDVRYLPGQDPGEILSQVRAIPEIDVKRTFITRRSPSRERTRSYARCARLSHLPADMETLSVGRDGASDAAAFIEAGIPAVEFGPVGSGHHGPEEWVSLSSLARYRAALADFVRALPARLEERDSGGGLTAIEGGLA